MFPFKRSRRRIPHDDIPTKANRMLNLILLFIFLILVRIWHLSIIQHEQKVEESIRPQRIVVIEPATRATIRDRFNVPLALNKVQYQAAVLYSQLKEIPAIAWELDENGKKIKKFKRKEYIKNLASLLAKELNLDSERIEDLIHSKASYYSQMPFVIKENLSEKEYYHLRMMEKDWPGIYVRRVSKRYYPQGRVAADIVGYLGAINRREYEKILHEISALEEYIHEKERGEEPELPPNIESSAHARKRLKDLQEKAYTIHDEIGKTGLEAVFEEQLRGFYGKKVFYSDSKGNFLRELPGTRLPLPGQKVVLTLSAELQKYAEQLLAENERIRLVKMCHLDSLKQTVISLKHPWMKGGAIVVMDPNSGEILTLASYPRFNPNDFILSGDSETDKEKKKQINRWFENESYLAALWDQQQPFEKEVFDEKKNSFQDESVVLTWSKYLDFILPQESMLRKKMDEIQTLDQAVNIQRQVNKLLLLVETEDLNFLFSLLYPTEEDHSVQTSLPLAEKKRIELQLKIHQDEIKRIKKQLDPYILALPSDYERVLLIDLCRLSVNEELFSQELLSKIGRQSLSDYRTLACHFITINKWFKETVRKLYHKIDFQLWRNVQEKQFIAQKRKEEKQNNTYARPYVDYLDQIEAKQFQEFWELYQWDLFVQFLKGEPNASEERLQPYFDYFAKEFKDSAHSSCINPYNQIQKASKHLSYSQSIEYLKTFRPYKLLNRPLFGKYHGRRPFNLEKHLASAFYPSYGFGYGRSYAYRQASIQGSLFKIVTAYEALIQRFRQLDKKNHTYRDLNPLVIVDQVYRQGNTRFVGYTQDGTPIPQLYKGGRLPRSLAHQNNGEVDLIKALEVSSNPYFSLLAAEHLENPEDLSRAACQFSYGSRTGIELPGEISGKVPFDLSTNRTGLYAMAIGQHSLVVTPLQTAVMLSTLANGGKVLRPSIVKSISGRTPLRSEDQLAWNPQFAYQENLSLMGIDFPLFTAVLSKEERSSTKQFQPEIKRQLEMPEIIRQILLQGLCNAVQRTHEDAGGGLNRLYQSHPEALQAFAELKYQLLGKTSTSESVEMIDLDRHEGTNLYTHVWFGSIAFRQNHFHSTTFLLKDSWGHPELVVVVYLRYGGYGKEAAPLAAQIVKKWHEINSK